MDLRDALHTTVRRHCIERHHFWEAAYNDLIESGRARVTIDAMNWRHTFEAYSTFPRYLVWEAILAEVDRLKAQSASSLEALREELAAAGWRAQTVQTSDPALPPVAYAAMGDEREAFGRFVQSIQIDQPVEP